MAELIRYLIETQAWLLCGQMFEHYLNLDALKAEPDYSFYRALTSPSKIVHHLNALTDTEMAVFKTECHKVYLSYKIGGSAVLDRLLLGPPSVQLHQTRVQLFEWAAENSQMPLIEHLLSNFEVGTLITPSTNKVLFRAASKADTVLVNRLLELPYIRRACLTHPDHKVQPLINNGFKRALWLALQDSPAFEKIHHFEDLTDSTCEYLTKTATPGHDSPISFSALLLSLKLQILSLKSYDPLNTLRFKVSAPVKSRLEVRLGEDLVSIIGSYLGLPINLRHFAESKPLRLVAERCLRQWSLDAHYKRQAQSKPSDKNWRQLFLMELRGIKG